jgi:protein-S-isoprenylcysteine O-methyltransferase Ste14
LVYLVYFYGVVLAVPGHETGDFLRHVAINVGLFALFALHHSVLARPGVKRRLVMIVPVAMERSLYVWVASVLLVLMCAAWQPLPGVVYRIDGAAAAALHLIQFLGVLLTIRGAGVIHPLELAGIRQTSAPAAAGGLKIVGPFRWVRHPIYLGWMLMVFAAPNLTVNRLLFAGISSAYLILAIPWEETSLVAAHGDHYRAYQAKVRWRVIPGVW